MSDEIDWSVTTREGNRRLQRQEFLALPFREKVLVLEEMEKLARALGVAAPEQRPRT